MLGLVPDELYNFTFRQFGNAVAGRWETFEHEQRVSWERTRWQTALLLNAHTKKGQQLKPRDLGAFPWEKETKKGISAGWAQLKALANGKVR